MDGMARNPVDMRAMVRRELEKERVRQLIIAEEILRRRELEAEVRRELMMERQLAQRRAPAVAFPSDIRLDMYPGFNASSVPFPNRFDAPMLPLHGHAGEASPMIREVEPPVDLEANSEKASSSNVLLLAKPDPNTCKLKRKATTPPACKRYSANPLKLNEEWNCAICQVNVSSEQGLKEHLQGRLHMAKSTELTPRTDENTRCASAEGTSRPARNAEMTPAIRTKEKLESSHGKNARETSSDDQNKEDHMQNDGHALQKKLDAGDANEQCCELSVDKMQDPKASKVANFKFWCEICQIGTHVEGNFGSHLNGKKHMGRVNGIVTQKSRGRHHCKRIRTGSDVRSV